MMDNNTVDTIMNRRSVREYKNTQVSEKDIETIINAGLYAPSGRNLQTWHFTVVQNRDLIDEIEAAVSVVRGVKDFHPFFGAPTVIFISGDKSSDWMREDCAAGNRKHDACRSLHRHRQLLGRLLPFHTYGRRRKMA